MDSSLELFEELMGIKVASHGNSQRGKPRSDRRLAVVKRAIEHLDPDEPMTLRHLYYLLLSDGLLDSADPTEYDRLSGWMVTARMESPNNDLFEAIIDGTRVDWKPSSWSGLADFTETVQDAYRKDLWEQQKDYVEFWFEKDAVTGIVRPIAQKYDVRIRTLRGQSSTTHLYEAAKVISQVEKPVYIYYFGDHDPSGYFIEDSAFKRLDMLLERFDCFFPEIHRKRLGFLPQDFKLPGILPLKAKQNKFRAGFIERFGSENCAELDALDSATIKGRMEQAILRHIDLPAWRGLQAIEKIERESFNKAMKLFADSVEDAA